MAAKKTAAKKAAKTAKTEAAEKTAEKPPKTPHVYRADMGESLPPAKTAEE